MNTGTLPHSPNRWLAALVGGAFLLFAMLGGVGLLYNETDGQYSAAARVMAEGGSWLIPENNGMPRLQKPPLLYWMSAVSMSLFGINEFAARLPGALAMAATVWATALIGSRLMDPRRGLMAGAIFATFLGTFTLGRIIMPEPLMTAFIAWAIYCLLRMGDAESGQARAWAIGFWLAAGLAAFSKGPHGLLYPVAIAGLAAIFNAEGRKAFRGSWCWPGPLLALAINLPWYLYVEREYPGWLHQLVFSEFAGHLAGTPAPIGGRDDVPPGQFLFLHLVWFFPWLPIVIVGAIGKLFAPKPTKSVRPGGQTGLPWGWSLVGCWGGVVLGSVLVLGQRQDYYAMSMWPVVAIALAFVWEHIWAEWEGALLALVGLLIAGLIFVQPQTLDAGTTADRSTAWNTFARIGELWEPVRPWAILAGTGLFAIGALLLLTARRNPTRGFIGVATAATLLGSVAVGATGTLAPWFSLGGVAAEIRSHDARIVYDGGLDTGSSLLFYTDQPILLLTAPTRRDVASFARRQDRFIDEERLIGEWKSARPLLLITESTRVEYWQRLLHPKPVQLWREGTQVGLSPGQEL